MRFGCAAPCRMLVGSLQRILYLRLDPDTIFRRGLTSGARSSPCGVHQLLWMPALLHCYHGACVHPMIKVHVFAHASRAFSRSHDRVIWTGSVIEGGLFAIRALARALPLSPFSKKLGDDERVLAEHHAQRLCPLLGWPTWCEEICQFAKKDVASAASRAVSSSSSLTSSRASQWPIRVRNCGSKELTCTPNSSALRLSAQWQASQ